MKKETGLIPPQDLEIEKAILGALLLERDALMKVTDILTGDSFYSEKHKLIFEAVIDLFSENEPIDLLTVTKRLRKSENLADAGGVGYVTELTYSISSGANIESHARIISEYAIKRQLIFLSGDVIKESYLESSDAFEVVGKLENYLIGINNKISVGKTFKVSQIFFENIERIQRASKNLDGVTGIKTGYKELDRITAGWQGSDLIIVAARPAMGKTDLAINFARNAAIGNVKTAIFSLEMSKEQLFDRYLAIDLEISRDNIKRGQLNEIDWEKVTKANKKTQENFLIQDEPGLTVIQFRSICRRLKMKEGIGLVILDYLQLMGSAVKGSTNDKVSDISRNLKLVAKELNIPVIALSQLSRSVESRTDKKPMLSDLRDSGAIEQDADIVIFPYRPIKYRITEKGDITDTNELMELDISKNRSGAVGDINVRYLNKFGKITDWDIVPDQYKKVEQETYRPVNSAPF